jgi:hypothetical protein
MSFAQISAANGWGRCAHLRTLKIRTAADLQRARLISSVVLNCSMQVEELSLCF